MELLKIQNFAGIKEMEFEFKAITVLIGPQASGKSISVKLLYFFKRYIQDIEQNIISGKNQLQYDKKQKERFLNYFPKKSWTKGGFKITYVTTDFEIKITGNKNSLNIVSSNQWKTVTDELRSIYKKEIKAISNNTKYAFDQTRYDAKNKLFDLFREKFPPFTIYNQYFIPAGRSFFANIQGSVFSFLKNNRSLDPFLLEFGSFYGAFKKFYDHIDNKNLDDSIYNILNSKYKPSKDKDYLIHADSRKVNLSSDSSGQQETLPLVILLAAINSFSFATGGATIYIEEPEAHLFPVAQKRMVQLLAKLSNNKQSKFQIIVTTHSPYILASFNNLLQAGHLSKIKPRQAKKIAAIIPKDEQIHPDLFCAYSLDSGHKKNLIDEESKLISQTVLDSVSNEIAKEFGALLDIEF